MAVSHCGDRREHRSATQRTNGVLLAAGGGGREVARAGGTPQQVGNGFGYAIALDANSVYYTNNDSVLRVAK